MFSAGHSGGGLYAHGPVQPAPPAQSAQPLLRPGCQCPRTGSQGSTTECHGERYDNLIILLHYTHPLPGYYFELILCFVSSILQGAWLCLLWRAGGDCDGSAIRQGSGRPLLCQPGPQQRLDGHGSLDLTRLTAPPACLPTCLSDWCTVSITCKHQHLTRSSTNHSPAGQTYTNDHLRISCSVYSIKVWACSNNTTVSGWALHSAHCIHNTNAYFSEVSENEQDSKVSCSTLLELQHLCLNFSPSSSTLTLTQSFPQSQTCKTTTGSLSLSLSLSPKLIVSLILNCWNDFFFLILLFCGFS